MVIANGVSVKTEAAFRTTIYLPGAFGQRAAEMCVRHGYKPGERARRAVAEYISYEATEAELRGVSAKQPPIIAGDSISERSKNARALAEAVRDHMDDLPASVAAELRKFLRTETAA